MPPPYSAGSVFLQVVPSFAGVQEDIKAHAERYGKLFGDVAGDKIGEGVEKGVDDGVKKATDKVRDRGKKAGEEFAKGVKDVAPKVEKEFSKALAQTGPAAEKQGAKAAEKYAGKFATTLKRQVGAMNRELDAIQMHVDDAEALAGIERVRRAVSGLKDGKIEVDFDGEEAVAAMVSMEKMLTKMSSETMHIWTAVDLDQAARDAAVVRKMVESVLTKPVDIPVNARPHGAGDRGAIGPGGPGAPGGSGGPFGALSERALGSFERTFRRSIESALRDMPALDISIDDDQAKAEVERIRGALQELRGKRLGTDLSTDDALAKLRELMEAVSRLEGMSADVRVRSDASTAYRELRATFDLVEKLEKADATVKVKTSGVATAAGQLRSVNSEAKKSSVNGMDAANAFRAFNGRIFGFVALAPAAIPLLGALAGGLAAVSGAALLGGAALGVGALGFSGISDAVQGMNDVQQNAANDAVGRTRQLRGAARGVRDAEQQLERAREDGARSVVEAEKRVAQAQDDARQAQEDLIDARREGARQLEDLSLRARGGALGERQAALDLAKAQAAFISTFADGSATAVEREEVAIALEREKLGYEQARLENQRLQEQQAEAARTGVEGTEAYQGALGQVASANEAVQDAELDRQRAQEDAAQSIADATQSLADAQEDYAAALEDTGDVGSSSMRRLKNAMAELGPEGQKFAKFLYDLKPFLKELRAEAQEGLLPGVQSWMESITGYHGPQLLRTVRGISGALGDVFEMWGQSLQGTALSELFDMIESDGPRWIRDMGEGVTDIGEGLAYLLVAARPFTDLFLGYFKDLSRDFKDWASTVKGSTGLQDFFDYVKRIAPEAGEFLKQFGRAALNLLEAVAPYGEVVLNLLTGFLEWVGDMDPVALGAIATGIFTLATAMQTIFGLTSLVKSAEAAWHLATGTLGGFTGKVPLLAGGVIALVGGLVLLYMNSEDFRKIVDDVAEALGDLIGWITDATGPVGALSIALGGLAAFKVLPGYIGSMRNPTAQLATATDMLGDSYGRTTGKLGLLTKALGGLVIAAAAWEVLKTNIDANVDNWTEDMMSGPAGLDKARAEMRAERAKIDRQNREAGTLKGFFSIEQRKQPMLPWETTPEEDFAKAKKQYQEQLDAMKPLERAQYDVKVATDELSVAQEKYGVRSDQARVASDQLRTVQGQLEQKQKDLRGATRDATDALIAQANAQLAAADSDIAFEQAGLTARRAQEKYAEVLADGNATADDRKDAELALRSAYRQVSDAALRQAQDQAELRGETLTSTEAASAQLESLKTLRDTMGGEVPEAITTLIADLERTAGTAQNVSLAVDGVTGAIDAVPGQKEVKVNALTDEAKEILRQMGVRVEEMEDGSVTLFADDDPAQLVLDTFIAEGQKREIVIPVRAGFYKQFLDDLVNGPKPNPNSGSPTGGSFSGPGGMWVPAKPNATGGPIEGPGTATSDSVPILASDGEYMIRASSVAKYGIEFFDLINAGRFATGGLVGDPISIPRWTPSADVSAIDVTPLAQMWGETVNVIGAVTGDAAPLLASMWAALNESAQQSVTNLRAGATQQWTGLGSDLTTQTETSLSETERRFEQMETTVGRVVGGTRDTIRAVWGDLRGVTADPVNFVINTVLNAGLFPALNSVATTFGLDKTIPNAQPVTVPRFATGGRVPGFSPSKTADNVPAMLTAGEYVQPVDSVQYYGSAFMEALRKRQIPKDALPAFANGGLVGGSWRQLDAIRAQLFPSSVMTSGVRPGARDHHGAGNAIDIGVAGNRPSQLAPIAHRIAMMFPNSLELINNPGGSIKNGRPVPPSFWGPATWAAHATHVHWAATAAQIAAGVLGAKDIPSALSESLAAPVADMFTEFGKSDFTQLLADGNFALADSVWAMLMRGGDTSEPLEATLYDEGGYLPPGLSMVMNATGKPEPVLTAAELDLLRNGGGHDGERSLIGALTLPVMNGPSVEDIAGEIMHVVTVADRGGAFHD